MIYYKIKLSDNKVEVLDIVKKKGFDSQGIMFVTLDELNKFNDVDMSKLRTLK